MPTTYNEVKDWVDNQGIWLHGGYTTETAKEWLATGWTLAQIDEWVKAGAFYAAAAVELAECGITPQNASMRVEGCTLAYWYCNNDMSLEEIERRIAGAIRDKAGCGEQAL